MSAETVVGITSAAIALVALVVAYTAEKRSRQNADAATQLSFQSKKNEIAVAVTGLRVANQEHTQRKWKAIEEFREVSEEVEALELPELSDQAREFRRNLVQAVQQADSTQFDSLMHEISDMLSELPAGRATSTALLELEKASGLVQQMEVKLKEQEAAVTSAISPVHEAIILYREKIIPLGDVDEEEEDTAI